MEKRIPFFKKVIICIKDLDKYNLLISEKLSRSIIYFLELMIIFTLIVAGVITYKTSNLITETSNYIANNVPDFTIDKEGLKLDSEEAFIIENTDNVKVKIVLDDKTETEETYQEQINEYDRDFILMLKNKVILIINGNKMEMTYENLLGSDETESINKNNIISLFNENKVQINSIIYVYIFAITYFVYTIITFIDALALSLLVIIISKMARISLKYSQALIIGISSLTLPIIINLIYTCVNLINGFYMPYFQVMYTLIAYIYIVAVILIIRSDLIKKKQLIKATIELKELEKNMENREEKETEDNEDKKDNQEDDSNKSEKKLDDVNRKTKGKNGPEPQANANIEGGK